MPIRTKLISIKLVSLSVFLSSCISSPHDPELVAAALSSPGPAPTIYGQLLNDCLQQRRYQSRISQEQTGSYDANLTISFMREMARGTQNVRVFAPRVRVYKTRIAHNSWGKVSTLDVACAYDFSNDSLTYLSTFPILRGGRVMRLDFQGAVSDAYRKFTGWDQLSQEGKVKHFLFGDFVQ